MLREDTNKESHLLCNQEVAFRVLEELVQLENIRMVHLFQDADLC